MANLLRPGVLLLMTLLLLQSLEDVLGLIEKPPLNPLFEGNTIQQFYDHCTKKASEEDKCLLTSPEDFLRLEEKKRFMKQMEEFYTSIPRLVILLGLQGVILVLMLHLTIVRHFDWRSLPIINLRYDKEQYQDKTHGVTYQQYIWMRYLVLRGNHPVFKGRDYRDVSWYKYQKNANRRFDYKAVNIKRFTFLDKKTLTQHLIEDLENLEKGEGGDANYLPHSI